MNRTSTKKGTPRGKRFWASASLVAGLIFLAACGDPAGPGVGSVSSVDIEPTSISVEVGSSTDVTATVNATGNASRDVTWSSSDPSIASVQRTGERAARVTGVAVGTTTITATSRTDATKSDTLTVTVTEAGDPGDPGDPVAPDLTFTADPTSVTAGETSTLTWNIVGSFTRAVITDALDDVVADDVPASGTLHVTPEMTEEYTLTVHYGTSSLVQATTTVTVTGPVDAPTLSSFAAEVVPGSQVRLTWTGDGATNWELFAVGSGATQVSLASGAGNGGDTTVDIPSSATPGYRVVLTNAAGTQSAQLGRPNNVVVSDQDYDPYDAGVFEPEPAIPGTLRQVLDNAAPGTVIGFASDITTIELTGVGFHRPLGGPNADAHLIVAQDVTISGPAGGVVLQGGSNQPAGDTSDPLTWRSRMVYVAPGVTATLENLTLKGGDFIVSGAGIMNRGTLTVNNLVITGNRAFSDGGGVRNEGTLTITDSQIIDNGAYTADDEVGKVWDIRGALATNPEAFLDYGDDPMGIGGGIINRPGGVLTITNSVVRGNHAYHSGGGIYNDGTLTAVGTDVTGNSADFTRYAIPRWSYGGGIMNGAVLDFTGGSISDNESAQQGGGLWHAAGATTTLSGLIIERNTAGLGGQPGFGGGIMERFFTGESPTLDTLPAEVYGPDNQPQDYNSSSVDPPAPGASLQPLDYRMEPPLR